MDNNEMKREVKTIMLKTLTVIIIIFSIFVILSRCSFNKTKSFKHNNNISYSTASTADDSLSKTNGTESNNFYSTYKGEYISFVDGDNIYIATPDGNNATKVFEAKYPSDTYHHSLHIQNGRDYLMVFVGYLESPDFEDALYGNSRHFVNIHTKKAELTPSSIGSGEFIPNTNNFIYYKDQCLNIYEIERKSNQKICGIGYDIISPDMKRIYFRSHNECSRENPPCSDLYENCRLMEYDFDAKKQNIVSDDGTDCYDIIPALSNNGKTLAYMVTHMETGEFQLVIKDTRSFSTIKRISINVPVKEVDKDLKRAYVIKKLAISPTSNKIAYVVEDDFILPKNRYFEVVDLISGRIIQKKTSLELYKEDLEWSSDKKIIIKKWNDKFNKDKGKKEKPYIERVIDISE
jgi:hypothetical protein